MKGLIYCELALWKGLIMCELMCQQCFKYLQNIKYSIPGCYW